MRPRYPYILKLPRYVYSTVKDDSYCSKIFQEEIEIMVGINQVLGLIFFLHERQNVHLPIPSVMHVLVSENINNTQTHLFGTKGLFFVVVVVIHMGRLRPSTPEQNISPETSLWMVTQNEQAPSAGFFKGMTHQ